MVSEIVKGSVDLADGTPISPTTADQTIKNWNIGENKAEYIKVHIVAEVETTGTSEAQTLDFELVNEDAAAGTSAVATTINRKTYAALGHQLAVFDLLVKKQNRGFLRLRLGNAGSADAQTTIKHKQSWLEYID